MSGSSTTGSSSGLVGIALLIGAGMFGFYTMGQVVRPGTAPPPAPKWSVSESVAGDQTQSDLAWAEEPEVRTEPTALWGMRDPNELPDLFPGPNMNMGAMPEG